MACYQRSRRPTLKPKVLKKPMARTRQQCQDESCKNPAGRDGKGWFKRQLRPFGQLLVCASCYKRRSPKKEKPKKKTKGKSKRKLVEKETKGKKKKKKQKMDEEEEARLDNQVRLATQAASGAPQYIAFIRPLRNAELVIQDDEDEDEAAGQLEVKQWEEGTIEVPAYSSSDVAEQAKKSKRRKVSSDSTSRR